MQVKVPKDRSYRLGKGVALDAFNERCYELNAQLHPTKGFRRLAMKRLAASALQMRTRLGWALLSAKITGLPVGGEAITRTRPHTKTGNRERARRARQMEARA